MFKRAFVTNILTNFIQIRNFENSSKLKVFPKQIFSGIQPTSIPHIGNYFGAIKQWVELQDNLDKDDQPMIISIVDLHALTLPQDPKIFNDYIYKCAATLIACGIQTSKTILYVQSQVPYHGQLSWILSTKVTCPQLTRMHQFKTKSGSMAEIPLGIFTYPVLQAADILLFKGTHVPVGEDQVQHLEFSREIAAKFNNFYKINFFPMPMPIETEFKRLKSLRDPTKKMSKSDPDEGGKIDLTTPPDIILKRIKRAVTDSTSLVSYDPVERPGVSTLIEIESACTGLLPDEIADDCLLKALDTGEYKKRVANVLAKHLEPIQKKYLDLIKNKDELKAILDNGSKRANQIAEVNFNQILKIIGTV